jgi:hypothetical protein
MFSRKNRRTLVLSLMISAGASSLPHAEAAPGRSDAQNAGPAVQVDLPMRNLMETMKSLWGLLKDALPSPVPHNPENREGPGIDPIGHPHPGGG